MKEEKEKQLEAVKKELNQKIEAIMGPVADDKPAEGKELYKEVDKESKKAPKPETKADVGTAPLVADAPIEEPKVETPEETNTEPEPEAPADPKLDEAVDDIAAKESDELLKVDDEVQKSFASDKKSGFGARLKDFFKNWWGDRKKRNLTLAFGGLLIFGLAAFPTSRYFVLNNIGVRSSASLKVLDEGTSQPLKNVTVSLDGQTGTTNDDGYVKLTHLKLGKHQIKIERRAFATVDKTLTLGWGSNPLGDYKLTPVGLQYTFHVADFLSDKPIQKAEAFNGDASAFANEKGEVVLTLDTKSDENVPITIRAEGYRDEKLTMTASDSAKDIKMVPNRKHAFVSKRSGKFDVYKIDADGKNEELVLSGTGSERDDMVLVEHPDRNMVALVSTRENMHNEDGYLLSTLSLINLEDNKVENIGRSEKFQIVGWVGDRVIYVKIVAGASAENPKRQKLISYDYLNGDTKELASSNYFNDVIVARDKVFYAPSGAYQNGVNVSLFSIDPDGSNKTVLIPDETWNIFRTGYDTLTITVGKAWYKYTIGGNGQPVALNGAPANPDSRLYANSPDGKHSAWVDQRDGKGVLIIYDTENGEDHNLVSQSGLANPIQWLNDSTIVFRVSTSDETADYVVSLDGGQPKKLTDVTKTAGIERWYYY